MTSKEIACRCAASSFIDEGDWHTRGKNFKSVNDILRQKRPRFMKLGRYQKTTLGQQ